MKNPFAKIKTKRENRTEEQILGRRVWSQILMFGSLAAGLVSFFMPWVEWKNLSEQAGTEAVPHENLQSLTITGSMDFPGKEILIGGLALTIFTAVIVIYKVWNKYPRVRGITFITNACFLILLFIPTMFAYSMPITSGNQLETSGEETTESVTALSLGDANTIAFVAFFVGLIGSVMYPWEPRHKKPKTADSSKPDIVEEKPQIKNSDKLQKPAAQKTNRSKKKKPRRNPQKNQ